ncbi:MAG: response regulator transcription factor [Dehalococcoidia bacterium]
MSTLTVVLVDDHQMFREGIRRRLEQEPDIEVVGEANDSQEALDVIEETRPGIAVLDIRMGQSSGLELAKTIRQRWPSLRILMLSGFDFDQYVRAAIRFGVDGYLLKDAPQDALVSAIRQVHAGGAVLPPGIASKVIRAYTDARVDSAATGIEELTLREVDVLWLMHEGRTNQGISDELAISIRTVESHVSAVMAKLGARNRTEAVLRGLEYKLIQ